ncbi:putative cytochrome P450 [Rosa chinensis]|uniref:Putative cytochrome P450 n=1 Tax=Rosa chinensis TaxID=74649 RepID=A0A2P6RVQ4_ROSCH|nr:putative cytochrome P450 [Rosa chinensis]
MDLEDPREKRAFNEEELMHQCSEILNSGTDTMNIILQWTMANVVKYPRVQKRLVEDIKKVQLEVGFASQSRSEKKKQEGKKLILHFQASWARKKNFALGIKKLRTGRVQKMHYLKAVMMEALRLHPPGHYVVPHTVTEDIVLAGRYTLPKNCTVNFMVAEIGRDSSVWDEPMEFKPERFMKDGGNVQCDITGSKEIMMIPFGAGRRICQCFFWSIWWQIWFGSTSRKLRMELVLI